jgi:hypothetical protein
MGAIVAKARRLETEELSGRAESRRFNGDVPSLTTRVRTGSGARIRVDYFKLLPLLRQRLTVDGGEWFFGHSEARWSRVSANAVSRGDDSPARGIVLEVLTYGALKTAQLKLHSLENRG